MSCALEAPDFGPTHTVFWLSASETVQDTRGASAALLSGSQRCSCSGAAAKQQRKESAPCPELLNLKVNCLILECTFRGGEKNFFFQRKGFKFVSFPKLKSPFSQKLEIFANQVKLLRLSLISMTSPYLENLSHPEF